MFPTVYQILFRHLPVASRSHQSLGLFWHHSTNGSFSILPHSWVSSWHLLFLQPRKQFILIFSSGQILPNPFSFLGRIQVSLTLWHLLYIHSLNKLNYWVFICHILFYPSCYTYSSQNKSFWSFQGYLFILWLWGLPSFTS